MKYLFIFANFVLFAYIFINSVLSRAYAGMGAGNIGESPNILYYVYLIAFLSSAVSVFIRRNSSVAFATGLPYLLCMLYFIIGVIIGTIESISYGKFGVIIWTLIVGAMLYGLIRWWFNLCDIKIKKFSVIAPIAEPRASPKPAMANPQMKSILNMLAIVVTSAFHVVCGFLLVSFGHIFISLYREMGKELPSITQATISYTFNFGPLVSSIILSVVNFISLYWAQRSEKFAWTLPILLTISFTIASLHLLFVLFGLVQPLYFAAE